MTFGDKCRGTYTHMCVRELKPPRCLFELHQQRKLAAALYGSAYGNIKYIFVVDSVNMRDVVIN